MNDEEIAVVVNQVLVQSLSSKGFENADVKSETDFDGGSIIRVIAHYDGPELAPTETANALHQIRDALLEKGEERFVILQSDYATDPEDQDSQEVED